MPLKKKPKYEEEPPDDDPQSTADALEALTPQEFASLYRYAQYKMRGLWLRDAEPKDWVQKAVLLTLEGKRVWNRRRATFLKHLKGCVSSMAHQAFKQAEREVRLTERHEAELAAEPLPKKEANERARVILKRVRDAFRSDKIVLNVLDLLEQGFPPALARYTLKMDAKVYKAARKRIVRAVEKVINHE